MTARASAAPADRLVVADDPADALARQALADIAPRPGAGYLPGDPDHLRDGLELGFHDAPRRRRLAMFQRDPNAAILGWRLATLIRACGADAALNRSGLIIPTWRGAPPVLRDFARRHRAALAAWLRLERDTGAPMELRRHARPPFGAAEALIAGAEWCVACGPPPPGAVATWHALPGSREWRCDTCCAPSDDDRVTFGYGLAGPDLPDAPAAAPRAAPAGAPPARKES